VRTADKLLNSTDNALFGIPKSVAARRLVQPESAGLRTSKLMRGMIVRHCLWCSMSIAGRSNF
jgi:hypothetical protein